MNENRVKTNRTRVRRVLRVPADFPGCGDLGAETDGGSERNCLGVDEAVDFIVRPTVIHFHLGPIATGNIPYFAAETDFPIWRIRPI